MKKGPNRELWGAYQREAEKLLALMLRSLPVLKDSVASKTPSANAREELYCLYRCAHTLKSSSLDVGRHDVAEVAERLEKYFRQERDGVARTTQISNRSLLKIVMQCQRLLKKKGTRVDTQLLGRVIASGGTMQAPVASRAKSLKVLLIEDSAYFERKIRDLLGRDKGFDFTLYASGTLLGGIEHLEKAGSDLVLLDLTLPDSDGLKTLEQVLAKHSKSPVVILTATDDKTLGLKAIAAGAQDYLVKKEVTGGLLSRSIRYALERHHLLMELERAHQQEREQLQGEIGMLKELAGTQERSVKGRLPKQGRGTLRNVALGYEEMLSAYLKGRENKVDTIQRNFCRMLLGNRVSTKAIVECHLLAVKKVVDNVDRVLAQGTLQTSRMLLLQVMTRYASLLQEENENQAPSH